VEENVTVIQKGLREFGKITAAVQWRQNCPQPWKLRIPKIAVVGSKIVRQVKTM
jgi:hypothetical protein